MTRLFAVFVGLAVIVLYLFPEHVHHAVALARSLIDRLAVGAAGAYGGLAR